MGRSTDVPGSETVRGTSSPCGALSVSAPRPAGLSGPIRNTTGALLQSSNLGSGIDRGTERTAARIVAGSKRCRLTISLHRSTHPPSIGSRHCMPRHCPSPSILVGHPRGVSAWRNYGRLGYRKPLLPGTSLCWTYPGAERVESCASHGYSLRSTARPVTPNRVMEICPYTDTFINRRHTRIPVADIPSYRRVTPTHDSGKAPERFPGCCGTLYGEIIVGQRLPQ